MNDFTKEELSFLKWCVLQARAHNPPQKGTTYLDDFGPLVRKIKDMIDNWCEHDGEIGKDYPAEKCMKCGAYWE